MSRLSWLACAAFLAACASGGANTETASAPAAATAPSTTAAQDATFTDGQLQAYLAARAEIDPIQSRYETMSEEERAQARTQITDIIERHGLTAVTYDAIARQARNDAAFANRLTALQPDTFSDDNLRAFAAASIEIEPINRTLATATPEQRSEAAAQIRAILDRHNLDGATYNAIATRAQSDPDFADRIRTLHEQSQSAG